MFLNSHTATRQHRNSSLPKELVNYRKGQSGPLDSPPCFGGIFLFTAKLLSVRRSLYVRHRSRDCTCINFLLINLPKRSVVEKLISYSGVRCRPLPAATQLGRGRASPPDGLSKVKLHRPLVCHSHFQQRSGSSALHLP